MALHERLHHPKRGDLLVLAIVLACSFYPVLVDRKVFNTGLRFIVYPFPKTEPNMW